MPAAHGMEAKLKVTERRTTPDPIIAQYAEGPKQLETAIAGLSPSDLDAVPRAGGWSIRQIVHHLADGDDLWKAFIKQAIGHPGSGFELAWYWQKPQDEWAKEWAYDKREVAPSLALFRSNRDHIVQLLEHVPGSWGNCLRVRWPDGEERDVSLGWVVEMQTRHVDQHLGDIAMIREKHGI